MKQLVNLVYAPLSEWADRVRPAFNEALQARYHAVRDLTDPKNDEKRFQLRTNRTTKEDSVPYAALVAPGQELSGPYGGMSFVMFPAIEAKGPTLLGMVVGTNGLAPDEGVLGRPGHARKCAAISASLNRRVHGSAWAKRDPVRIDLGLPKVLGGELRAWDGAREKYGRYLYATFIPPAPRSAKGDEHVAWALTAMIDLFFEERDIRIKKEGVQESEAVRREWLAQVLPGLEDDQVLDLLKRRRFAVIEGPPGTGKSELAGRLLKNPYGGRGRIIQFHPGTTYESFVGGLAPQRIDGALGFTFQPTAGHLMEAARAAGEHPDRPYLLVIDEINRGDLAKVLGEAIYLLEPDQPGRTITLAHDFDGFGRTFALPGNLHVLGTMNSADRSIAILDVAVRRRFSFVPLWPQLAVVEKMAEPRLQTAFRALLDIFVEHASDDVLPLMPGHCYFFGKDSEADLRLRTQVRPLLEEYLAQGYVAGFADEVRAYLDRIAQGTGTW